MLHRIRPFALLAALAPTPACDDDHAHPGEPSLEAEACEHMTLGPAAAVTASAEPADDLPDVNRAHTRVDVTLQVLGHGSHIGYLALNSAAPGRYHLFLSKDVPLEVQAPSGAAVPFAASGPPRQGCAAIVVHHQLDLGVGRHLLAVDQTLEGAFALLVEAPE